MKETRSHFSFWSKAILLAVFCVLSTTAADSDYKVTFSTILPWAEAGKGLAITCFLNRTDNAPLSSEQPSFDWLRLAQNGQTQPVEKPRVSYSAFKKIGSRLIFSPVKKPDDVGEFECRVSFTDEHGNPRKLSDTIQVSVSEPIAFADAETEQHPVVGSEGEIRCSVKGDPIPDTDWFRVVDNEFLPLENGRYSKKPDNTLVIDAFTEADNGDYICRATQSETGEVKDLRIEVSAYTNPEINVELEKENLVNEGQTIQLKCKATGNPAPIYKWLKDGVDIKEDEHHSFPAEGVLEIKEVQEKHQGAYTCRATNVVGHAESSGTLNVFLKPKIVLPLASLIKVPRDGPLELVCQYTGENIKDAYWEHGTTKLRADENINGVQVTAGDNSLILKIEKMTMDHNGDYLCYLSNDAGIAQQNVLVQVEHAPIVRVKSEHRVKSFNGNEVSLICTAEAVPQPNWTWLSPDGEEISSSVNYNIVEAADKLQSTLKVVTVSGDSYGEYKCKADNGVDPSADATITVEEVVQPETADSPTVLTSSPTSVEFEVDNYATLSDEDNKRPTLIVVQYSEVASGSDSVTVDWDLAQRTELTFSQRSKLGGLSPSSNYVFRVAGKNIAGESEFSEMVKFDTPEPQAPEKPVVSVSDEVVCSSFPCEIVWSQPNDNGSPITQYLLRYVKVLVDSNGEKIDQGRPSQWEVVSSLKTAFLFDYPEADTFYKIELKAENEKGESDISTLFLKTGPNVTQDAVTTGAVIAIVVILILIVLIVIDVACYYLNQCGLLMFVCVHCCGKSSGSKAKDILLEEGHHERVDDKQPLKGTYVSEKEPDDKGADASEGTPMILDEKEKSEQLASVKNSAV